MLAWAHCTWRSPWTVLSLRRCQRCYRPQVVGHTIQRGINSACEEGARVYRIDVGMSKAR